MRFDRFLQERILGPLGMVDTGFNVPASKRRPLRGQLRAARDGSAGYELIDDPATSSSYARPRTYFSGAGGLVSTDGRLPALLQDAGQPRRAGRRAHPRAADAAADDA